MNEFLIELQAKLDEAKSKGNINSDIKKLQNQIDKLKLQAEIDPKTISNLVKQLEGILNQKINISNIGINSSNAVKEAQQTGQQIGNAINQGVTNAVNKTNSTLKSFSDLKSFSELNKSISNFHVDSTELKNYKSILDDIKNTYAEFGQVRITNEIFKDGVLEKFKVNIEQVNGDLKETKSFIMALNEEKDAFVFSGLISGSESVVQHLDKTKDAVNQTAEAINALKEKAQIDKIQFSMGDKGDTTTQIKTLTDNFTKLGLSADEIKTKMNSVDTELSKLKTLLNNGASNSIITTQFDKLKASLKEAQNDLKTTRSEYSLLVSAQQRLSKANTIEAWKQKNSAATKQAQADTQAYIDTLRNLNVQMTKMEFDQITRGFKETEISMRGLNKLGASLKDQFSQAAQSFTQWLSVSSAVMLVISKTRNAITELKEINTLLTETSKANDKLSKSDLNNIGNNSFDIASKYGKSATDYLTGIQEMSRAGYENAESMAELSVAAQGAGDMTAELANKYIIATDVAFKMNGSIEALTATLDGANSITNHNAVNMTELAEGMSVVGIQAASSQMKVNEITAAIGTMVTATQKSGREMGNAFKGILMNLQQVSGDVGDGEDIIDAESLTKYEKACAALGVSLKEVRNGVVSLKEPMQILKELAEEYTKLDEADAKRANLLSAVGGKYRANALNAILENYDLYEKMLKDYADGIGSMAVEAEKTANSWEGSMNRLSNTWTDTVENIADSDAVITTINGLNSLLSVVNTVTDKLGSLGTIGLGAGIFGIFKNVDYLKTPVCPLYI